MSKSGEELLHRYFFIYLFYFFLNFNSVEQAYQYCKAKYVDDVDSATKLLYTVDPGAAKKIGSGVAGINGTN